MSWNIDLIGTKDAVRAKAVEAFDKAAASYEGKDEANDVKMVKERALAKLDALTIEPFANAVKLSASGSDSPGMGGSFKLEIYRTSLTL